MDGTVLPPAAGDIWVFAYGSLMWTPGFPFVEVRPARLHGYHRALCIYSIRGRGTDDRPGLVLGLDRGGSCVGRAYRVAAAEWEAVGAYLHAREMVTNVYRPAFLTVRLDDGRRVAAYGFVARRDHVQYTGRLSEEKMAELILQGAGWHGTSLDYLSQTVAQLDGLGITAGALHRILTRVEAAAVPPARAGQGPRQGRGRDDGAESGVVLPPDQPLVDGVLPDGEPRARGAPRLHHLGIGARPGRHPFNEIEDQGVDVFAHD